MPQEPVLSMRGITIAFPGVLALSGVDFSLLPSEVHALMGENGAGKSTLIKCLTGVHHMDKGEIFLSGKPITPTTPQAAIQMGISTVFQEINLCANLTVAENIFIGRQPMKRGAIDWRRMNARSEALLSTFEVHIDVTRPLAAFSTAIQQLVSIARAVDVSASVLILDEPTSSLDEREVAQLFSVVRGLKDQGMGIIFITHFLNQVYQISDRITVLRNGLLVGTYETKALSRFDLVTRMIGKEISEISTLSRVERDDTPDEIPLLWAKGIGRTGSVTMMDVQLRRGETLGFAGLLGSGRTETAEMLFGATKIAEGKIEISGKTVDLKSPRAAIANKLAFCPEDRKRDGIIAELSIRENIVLALQGRRGLLHKLSRREQDTIADRYIKLLSIATPDAEKKVGELSGGNQQKVILARWLATEPDVLILDEPTRGIDVGAKAEIQKLTLSMCEKGMAIMFISSELDEVIRCSNRIVVMRDRRKAAELKSQEFDQQRILHIIAGGAESHA